MFRFLLVLLLLPVFTYSEPFWAAEENFNDFPNYSAIVEKPHSEGLCDINNGCLTTSIEGKSYYAALPINEANFKQLLVGTWTGGDCGTDYYTLDSELRMYAQHPSGDAIYSWGGHYHFEGNVYIENSIDGQYKEPVNDIGNLYFVPEIESLIYKQISKDEKEVFYFYFKKCEEIVEIKEIVETKDSLIEKLCNFEFRNKNRIKSIIDVEKEYKKKRFINILMLKIMLAIF